MPESGTPLSLPVGGGVGGGEQAATAQEMRTRRFTFAGRLSRFFPRVHL
jgi:hypothetical protein